MKHQKPLADSFLSVKPNTTANLIAVLGMQLAGLLVRPIQQPYRHWLHYRINREIARLVGAQALCIALLNDDSRYRFHLADPYWNLIVSRKFLYEPEISRVLNRIRNVDYIFLDLGANLGYWSVLVSSKAFGSHLSVAVEPVDDNFHMLCQNRVLNNNRFIGRKAAIAKESGKTIVIVTQPESYSNPGAFGVAADFESTTSRNRQTITTISIDDLCAEEKLFGRKLVIKLDVEGMELEALEGASRALRSDFLLIYEDHGSDSHCKVTEFVLSQGYVVFFCTPSGFKEIKTLAQVKEIKVLKTMGYNFFAMAQDSDFLKIFLPGDHFCDGHNGFVLHH